MRLEIKDLHVHYGKIEAIKGISVTVNEGEIVTLIGANGAGKTTLFNLLSNFITPDRGEVLFNGQAIHTLPSHRIARQGMVRTFQVAKALSRLSVLENLLLATQQQTGENFFNVWLHPFKRLW